MAEERKRFPLSLSQQNIWALERRYSGTSINIISATVHINGRVDFALLSKALNLVLKSDSSLRTRLVRTDEGVMQEHMDYTEEQFSVYDFTLTDPDGFAHWETAMTREPMPLYASPLCRFYLFRTGEEEGGVLVKSHHIIFDGWSQVLLCNRIADTYLTLVAGGKPSLEPSPDYEVHVSAEQEYLMSRACARDEKYWASLFETPAEPAAFKEQRGASVSPVGRRRSYKLPEILNHAIAEFCLQKRVSPFAPYYMALAIAARRMGSGKRMMMGVPIHNRTDLVARQTTGMFVSTLPLIMELDEDWTIEQFNDRLSESWLDLLRHQRFPFEKIEALPGCDGGRLFHVALSYQDNLSYKSANTTVHFSGRWNYSGYQAEQLCIHVTNLEDHRRYTVDYDYLAQLFTDDEIDRLHKAVCTILDQILTHPDRPIREVCILSAGEREQVLYSFNRTLTPLPEKGLWETFYHWVETCPERAALIENGGRTTYGQLYKMAASGACLLKDKYNEPEPLTAVLLPRGRELAGAIMSVMASGGAWLLLSAELPRGRVADIISAGGVGAVITSEALAARFGDALGTSVILTDELFAADASAFTPPETAPEKLAYVVYTSGSTGAPKGVEIMRKNLLNFACGMKDVFPRGAMLSLSNISFDAFVLECVTSLLNGLTVVFAGEEEQEDPSALARLMTDFGVDYMCLTPSRLATYLEYPEFRAALSGRKGILCGGEAFSGELLSRLKELTCAHVYNQYGPSETTVGVSIAVLDHCSAISVGKPMQNCVLYVLDDRLSPVPTGVYGQLYIGGESVGRGYRSAPEMTEKAFLPDPFLSDGRMYRSGDVACWTTDGELRLGGRTDRQLKLRGQRVEPDELKFCLEGHPSVKKAAVRAVTQYGQTVLCAYFVPAEKTSETELMRYLAERLPVYLLPARIIEMAEMPMTASGKVDEKALPEPALAKGDGAPKTAVQEKILDVFRRVLERSEMGADGDYFLFGGNSLNAMETVGLLEPVIGRRMRVSDLYACRTAQGLDVWLNGAGVCAPTQPTFNKAEERDSYPVSEMQKNIYVQCSAAPEAMAYHMPGAFSLGAAPDRDKLENAFRALIAQDDIYRTSFAFEKGRLCARILPTADFELQTLKGETVEEIWRSFLRPFDLASPPLVRAGLWDNNGDWILFMDVHHLVGDGVSTPILLRRLNAAYCGDELQKPALTYKDYCVWRESLDSKASLEAWTEHLSELPAPLDLPGDMPKPHPFDFKGGLYSFEIPTDVASKCEKTCREMELTPFMLFSAAYGLLLSRISGKDKLTIGTPVSGRSRGEMWSICGPFLATLPMQIKVDGGATAKEYLESVRQEVLWLLDHQELPLDELLNTLGLPRQLGENPLYQVMFTYRPLDVSTLELDGHSLEIVETPHTSTKAELCLECAQTGDKYCFTFEYAASVFQRETIEFYARCVTETLRGLTFGLEDRLESIDVLPFYDRVRLLEKPRQMTAPFRNVPIDKLISEKARMIPDAEAVRFHGTSLTYRQLEERATVLAGLLQAAGAKSGDCVGLCCQRTPDIFAGMLAILKNGCAYVPFLPDYPQSRIEYMLKAAHASLVLCDGENAGLVARLGGATPVLMGEGEAPFKAPEEYGRLMYVLFTSGSTGKPKGVMVPHRAVANYAASMGEILSQDEGPVLCVTNMTFDIFLAEGLLPLSMGRTVVLADADERTLPWRMAQCMADNGVTTMQITPSQLQMNLGSKEFAEAVKNIRLMLITGEACPAALVKSLSQYTDARLFNLYGPTETTVHVSGAVLKAGEPVTIGTPFKNCRMYVLDENGRDVFPTARGELYISGECLTEGYVSDAEKTRAAFVPDVMFAGEKMYRTGDVARLKADGAVDCLGRVDAQIKLNGLRIELDEINGAAMSSALVSQCVTVVMTSPERGAYLRSFAVPVKRGADEGEKIREHMRKLLPGYMIPAEIIMLDALPVNASGKADLQKLKAWTPADKPVPAVVPQIPAPAKISVQSSGVGSDTLTKIWLEALDKTEISQTESFFSQGGTSLSALGVLTEYYSAGISMTLADFYAHPTLREQAAMLNADEPDAPAPAPAAKTAVGGEPTAAFICRPAPTDEPAAESLPAKCVMITGATGFLGAHILHELLINDLAGTVLCLMRDDDRRRLDEILEYYFGGEWTQQMSARIAVARGDVARTRFGLDEGDYSALCRRTDAVFHTAADVRHYASDSKGWMTNVYGTAHAAQFALDAQAAFNHISTMSVSGEHLVRDRQKTAAFTENDFDIGQNWHDNIYVEGKFLAEQEVYDRIKLGLNARVYRLGRLVGRENDGAFQRNSKSNAVYLTLRGIQAAGAIPQSMAGVPMDLTPIDFCARAIVALSNGPMPVCHVIDPAPVTMLEAARSVYPQIEVMADADFAAHLAKLSKTDADGALAPLVEVWNRGMHDGPATIIPSCEKTSAMLRILGVKMPSSPIGLRLKAYSIKDVVGSEKK